MVARVVVGIPTVLCLWISEIIASLPGRCAVTVLELLTVRGAKPRAKKKIAKWLVIMEHF